MSPSEDGRDGVREVAAALTTLGVRPGDTIYVAASLAGMVTYDNPAATVFDALQRAVGKAGTILMPSGNGSFRYSGLFDREKSPSCSGILSEHFRTHESVLRTSVPPYNTICAWGRQASRWAAVESATAFGPGSVFDLMIEQDVRAVLIGCSFHDGVAHVHWLEERHDVPYREWRDFTGVLRVGDRSSRETFACHVRRDGFEPDASPIGDRLIRSGLMAVVDLGLTRMSSFRLSAFKDVADAWLRADPLALVRGAP